MTASSRTWCSSAAGSGKRWRSEWWDSFTLLSPNWQTRLPGHRYAGSDPDGFLPAAGVVDMLEAYGRGAPLRTGVTVDAVHPRGAQLVGADQRRLYLPQHRAGCAPRTRC